MTRGGRALALGVVAMGVVACGGGAPEAEPRGRLAANGGDAGAAARLASDGGAPDAGPVWPALDDLAARAPTVAAGMREEKRQEVDAAGTIAIELSRASSADLCARVSLVTTRPVHAWLEDGRANVLADGGTASRALLAPRGPVCIRKGDALTLRAEAAEPFSLRFVEWASP